MSILAHRTCGRLMASPAQEAPPLVRIGRGMLGVVVAGALLATCLTALASSPRDNVIRNDAADQEAVEAYWTEERLRDATPLPIPEVSEEEFQRLLQQEVAPGRPTNVESVEAGESAQSTPGVPERANVGERPFWNGGRLFFTKPDGKDYSCTGAFAGQNNIVLTAAHCVRDGQTGAWYRNFNFRRAYSNGGGQSVGWNCASAYYMWYTPPNNYRYDYAFIRTTSTSGAGWLGWKTQIPYTSWTAIGYPQNYGSNQYMYKVVGDKGPISGNIVQMNNNPFNFGASGGAWIAELTTPHVGGNYAVGVNSFIRSSDPGRMWGPLFDADFAALYTKAVNCTN